MQDLIQLILFVAQKWDDARHFLKYLHPDLGVGTNHMIYSLMLLCISTVVQFFSLFMTTLLFKTCFLLVDCDCFYGLLIMFLLYN